MSDDGILEPLDVMGEPRESKPRRGRDEVLSQSGGGGILEGLEDLADKPERIRDRDTVMSQTGGGGILESLDDMHDARRKGLAKRELFVEPGVRLEHTPSKTRGPVVKFTEGVVVVIKDQLGAEHSFEPVPGLFRHEGDLVALRAPLAKKADEPQMTASGSIAASDTSARVAVPSRIWVEGIHDAELVERVWGDDLRYEGVVVEQLEGADDLAARVREFGPTSEQRLGVLLDHLVDGTKESRIAAEIHDPNVLILGHPYVDIWQAIKPATIDIAAWPTVPMGESWKEGVLKRLGIGAEPWQFWKHILGKVTSWKDVETPLVNSVEQLIDFVTVPSDEAQH